MRPFPSADDISSRRQAFVLRHDNKYTASLPVSPSEADFRADFRCWALHCVKIKDKQTGRLVPFVLNFAQLRLLEILESQRRADKPIRVIMLKARQWGGSTLVQLYMAWIQMFHAENWHSIICAQVKDTSTTIRGMYSTMLRNYPSQYAPLDEKSGKPVSMDFAPFEGSRNIRRLANRDCHVTIASAEKPEAMRGGDYAMAHLTEVAFWPCTDSKTPDDLIRSICGSVARSPLSLIVMESTANGPTNYFHTEWDRAAAGLSDKVPYFVPWHHISIYSEELPIPFSELWPQLTDYERDLWDIDGITPEQICWYHHKRREYVSDRQMMAEYPTTDSEAFCCASAPAFDPRHIERLKAGVAEPIAVGDMAAPQLVGSETIRTARFEPIPGGPLQVWQWPDPMAKQQFYSPYTVAVDIGGTHEKADYSVIAVARYLPDHTHEIVAQWRGHIDHDILAWRAAQIAHFYFDALLVIESNTLETEGNYILERIAPHYRNLYVRQNLSAVRQTPDPIYGFHTNRATKTAALTDLRAALRSQTYIEHSAQAISELSTMIQLPDQRQEAAPGCHDDIVMTRAIIAYVFASNPPRPFTPL